MPPNQLESSVSEAKQYGSFSRREILRNGTLLGGGLLIGISLVDGRASGAEPHGASVENIALNAFVLIAPNDRITLVMPSVEMGQGVYTSNSMILAEELDARLDQVTPEHAPPDQKNYANPVFTIQATGGSTSTMAWIGPLRKAGATARAMLLQAAAARWRVDPSALRTSQGIVHHNASGRSISFGKLADQAAKMAVPPDPALKDPKSFTLIGKSSKRLDTPDKVTGKAIYGIDVLLPGMKFVTLAASPVFGGKVMRVDDLKAKAIPGVRQIVVLDDLIAVVGDHMWAAKQGLAALRIDWAEGLNANLSQDSIWSGLEAGSQGQGVTAQKEGDAPGRLLDGTVFEATYELPFLAHTPMEPMNCAVRLQDGKCEIWIGTQVPGKVQSSAAAVLGIDPAQVVVNNHLIGGGFGRRLEEDAAIKAVRIAQKVDGPIKVVWTREEDIRQGLYRPTYHDRLKAKVENGRITAWHHRVTGPSIMARWLPPAFKKGLDIDAVDGAIEQPYDFHNILIEFVRHETPIPVCFWRGVGPNSNIFSAECFLDHIARATKADPVMFRRAMLAKTPRLLAVLEIAANKAGWGKPLDPVESARTGRGVALLKCFGSYLACVAEVAVSDDGDVKVTRVVVAADVGMMINPDTVEAQIQGGVVFGVGTILHNKITIEKGRVQQSNFHDYRMLRMDEMPKIEVHLVSNAEKPGGIGEPPTVVVQPAIANAIFAATGVQLTRMPIDHTKISRN